MKMGRIPNNISDVVLYKIVGDKDGGAFKLTTNPVNVEHPQSLRHVQPICEFTAPDSRENLSSRRYVSRRVAVQGGGGRRDTPLVCSAAPQIGGADGGVHREEYLPAP